MSRSTHKRAAGSEEDSPHVPKKTRFVEPGDDPVNFAEEVDSHLENPFSRHKGRVKTEGYDSDSSDDGEGVVMSRRPQASVADDEDDDMFKMGETEGGKVEGGKKKKAFMRLGDIEGQVFEGAELGSDDDSGEDEPEDEDDAERRKKAGMGYELSSFNMREELEEGKFMSDGMYVRSFDPHAVHDRWMDGMDEREIKKAKKQHRHQEKIQKERMREEEEEIEHLGGKENIEKRMLELLKKGETVLEALQRLGARSKKDTAKRKPNVRSKANMGAVSSSKAPSDIDNITHLASTLMALGDADIYNKTYEELVRSVRASGKVDQSWVAPSADMSYEYVWDVPAATSGEQGQVFGPYSEEEMRSWYKASYFGTGGEKIRVRQVGGSVWGSWYDSMT